MKELRLRAGALSIACLFSVMGFAQDASETESDVVEKSDVAFVVNNENSLTPKPAFVFSCAGVNMLNSEGEALTKKWLRNNVTIEVNDVAVAFVVGSLTNGADTNVDTLTFITADNYYLPVNGEVKVTLPDLKFSGELYNDKASETYSFDVEDYIVISSAEDKPVFKQTKSVVIESGLTYEVAEGDELLCKTLVVEGGATLRNYGTVTVKDTAFFHCIKRSHFEQANLINKGTYDATSSVLLSFYDSKKGKSPTRVYGFAIDDEMKANELMQYSSDYDGYYYGQFTLYFTDGTGSYYNLVSSCESYPILKREAFVGNAVTFFNYFDDAYYRNKGNVYDEESELIANPTWSNQAPFIRRTMVGNPYPSMIDLKQMVSDEANVNSTGDVQLLNMHQYYFGNANFVYNGVVGLSTYDGEMWKGWMMPSLGYCRMSSNYNPEVTIKKDHMLTMSEAEERYSDYESPYPYIRFYCDYVAEEKQRGVGNRSVFVVYFVDDEMYGKVESSINAYSRASLIYESISVPENTTESLSTYEQYYPEIGFNRNATDKRHPITSIGACQIPTEGNEITLSVALIRDVESNTEDDYGVTIGVLDYDLKDLKLGFSCDELDMSFKNRHVSFSGKGEVGDDITFVYDPVDKKLFDFKFYYSEEVVEDYSSIQEVEKESGYNVSVQSDKITVIGDTEGAMCNLYSLSGELLQSKKGNNTDISFDISEKGVYFVVVETQEGSYSYKILL